MDATFLRKSEILRAVNRVSQEQGKEVYLVGGAVRDLLLGRPAEKDYDFAAGGEVAGLAGEVARVLEGKAFPLAENFGTWRVVLKKRKKTVDLDFSPLQGREILEDLKQRDFTVNSLAVSLKEVFRPGAPGLIDPLQGLADMERRVLRADSEESLRRDPLRMLRAFRLASALKFSVEEETLEMIRRNKDLLLRSAGERIRAEFFAALEEDRAERFLRKLHQASLLAEIFPEVKGWESLEIGPGLSLLEHSLRTVEAGELILLHLKDLYPGQAGQVEDHFSQAAEGGISRRALFKFAAFFHDSGKMTASSAGPGGETRRFLDHDQEGEKVNAAMGRRLRLSKRSLRILSLLTRQHMRTHSLIRVGEATPRAQFRFFKDLGKEGIELALLALSSALASEAAGIRWPLAPEMGESSKKIRKITGDLLSYYYKEFTQRPGKPLLDGREVMKELGVAPGEKVGGILGKLREAEAAGKVRTKEEALQFLRSLPPWPDSD